MKNKRVWLIHAVLLFFSLLTLLPFVFMVNNVFRSNSEFYHAFFSFPVAFEQVASLAGKTMVGDDEPVVMADAEGEITAMPPGRAMRLSLDRATRGPRLAWKVIRPYMLNTLVVALLTVVGVILLGSATAYILSRYRFIGHRALFLFIISTMMFPGVLTLVPSFLLVKTLGLLNTYWAMILPYIAGGQVFAIFVFKSYFEGLPEDLFESARIDGAGHLQIYWQVVLPLSKPILSVVAIMNILGTWNNFLWPFITNTEGSHHVVSSGLYVLATTAHASNFSTLYAAYAISSIPLLVLFIYATKPFIRGVTSGAFKA
ncbi:MAG: carbohydrate ABC transporter permease [Candidatus Latescibacterota bacterium]|jgi:ABC-type glycerol-3-phosphate transport system permease component